MFKNFFKKLKAKRETDEELFKRIYDLSGNVIQHARKGINIINGKKVLIK